MEWFARAKAVPERGITLTQVFKQQGTWGQKLSVQLGLDSHPQGSVLLHRKQSRALSVSPRL